MPVPFVNSMTELTTGQASPSIITLVFMVKNDLIPYVVLRHCQPRNFHIFKFFFLAFSASSRCFVLLYDVFNILLKLFI